MTYTVIRREVSADKYYLNCFRLCFRRRFIYTDSGRYIHKQRFDKMKRLICSTGSEVPQSENCVAVYRARANIEIDMENLREVRRCFR